MKRSYLIALGVLAAGGALWAVKAKAAQANTPADATTPAGTSPAAPQDTSLLGTIASLFAPAPAPALAPATLTEALAPAAAPAPPVLTAAEKYLVAAKSKDDLDAAKKQVEKDRAARKKGYVNDAAYQAALLAKKTEAQRLAEAKAAKKAADDAAYAARKAEEKRLKEEAAALAAARKKFGSPTLVTFAPQRTTPAAPVTLPANFTFN